MDVRSTGFFRLASIACALVSTVAHAQNVPPPALLAGGEVVVDGPHPPHMSDALFQQAQALSRQAQPQLGLSSSARPSFIWPVRKATHVADPGVDAVSNFVDQDPVNPGSLLDYACGARTYDLDGYDHSGIDIVSWPFSWHKMNDDDVEVVAAAPGTIYYKNGDEPDVSCGIGGSGRWNAVYVVHADGSYAWYGHMKRNSLTAKGVGDTVSAGEFLGVVGSSGSSTEPHLHFEVYDANGNLIDPFAGACNVTNADSWWTAQPAYYEPRINLYATATGVSEFNPCPQPATRKLEDTFVIGDRVVFQGFYRDQLDTTPSHHAINRPDGSLHSRWTFQQDFRPHYTASYWAWSYDSFGVGWPTGIWRYSVAFEGQSIENEFYLLDGECQQAIDIIQLTVSSGSTITYGASDAVSAGNGVHVGTGGALTLLSAGRVSLGNGFGVESGGSLTAANVPVCV